MISESLPGPWLQAFVVELTEDVMSKSNARRGKKGSKEERQYNANKLYETRIKGLVRDSLPEGWELGPYKGAPSQRPKVVCVMAIRSLLDASNATKSFLDAMQGVVYYNDNAVVCSAPMSLERKSHTPHPGVVGFARLAPDATPQVVWEAITALGQEVLDSIDAL